MDIAESRILIVKPSSLGDVVHTLPVAHCLKRCYPGCRIGWIVQESFADLLRSDSAVDDIFPIKITSTSNPGSRRRSYLQAFNETMVTLRRLRRIFTTNPYDVVLDLHASFRSGLLGRTNPGACRIGFKDARELNTFFQDNLITVPDHVEHALEKNLLFCTHLNCRVADEDLFMSCSRENKNTVHSFLQQQGIDKTKSILYANPAARWQTKFWPISHWAALADHFFAHGMAMVFAGSRQDVPYIATITELMKSKPLVAAGRFSLSESVALIQRSSLYVGLDSGPMHMAALAGVPVVALFGPTHPSRVGPYGVPHRIVRRKNLDCLECRRHFCDHFSCMKDISMSMVFEAAMALLTETSGLRENGHGH